jgi:hypothetical protein
MKHIPTEREGRAALTAHIIARAEEARMRHGPNIGGETILAMLDDHRIARYPTTITFDDGPLLAGEFAYPESIDDESGRWWRLCLRTDLRDRPTEWARIIAYYLPLMNYGPAVTHEDCLGFAGALLGEPPGDTERALCALCDAPGGRTGATAGGTADGRSQP